MLAVDAASAAVAALAFAYLAVISVILTVIDIGTHRLPNRIVLPSYGVGVGLLIVAAVLVSDPARLTRALAGMAILFSVYFAMRFASPASIGGGDVKLAGLLGLYLGWMGWDGLILATASAFLIGGVQAMVLLMRRRADRKTRIAFGPAMIVGAWVAIAALALPVLLPVAPSA
jgi:leader peptidase (prepilin peptidase) / N-methyltransferase